MNLTDLAYKLAIMEHNQQNLMSSVTTLQAEIAALKKTVDWLKDHEHKKK